MRECRERNEMGPCLADMAREIRSRYSSVCLPLCCRPDVRSNSHCGNLTRWFHLDLP
jgi:hypothetical protein